MSLFFAFFVLFVIIISLLYFHLRFRVKINLIVIAILIGLLASLAGNQVKQMGINFGIINKSDPIFNFIYSVFATGLSAQLLVFLFMKILIYPSKHFRSHIFGLLYCIWISIGFVLPEFLTMKEQTYPLLNTLNITGHISMSMLLGYFVSMAKFSEDQSQNFTYLNTGLAAIILIQGLHEFFILERQFPNLIVLILGTSFLALMLIAHLFRQHKAEADENQNSKINELYPNEQ
jgi:hypothetical protein